MTTAPTARVGAPGSAARPTPANRFGLDYRAEARRLGAPPAPIIDFHTHINGERAAAIYAEAAGLYGVSKTWSMTVVEEARAVRAVMGDRIRFIAVPSYTAPDRRHALTEGFLSAIHEFHSMGSRIVKFWAAPRGRDFAAESGDPSLGLLDNEWRVRAMGLAESLGMMFMTHVGDPDTWFATKYADASRYGTKAGQYVALERLLDRFAVPWVAAHMCGWPENLAFIDGMLTRHPNLHIDTSATKWMVREVSRHPRGAVVDFLLKWSGRVLFGSDIVTMDSHLSADSGPRGMGEGASSPAEAFDLYASRYYALRTMWETAHRGESPIADPDLMMVEPGRFDAMSAPRLAGMALPRGMLQSLYHDAAADLWERWTGERV